MHLVFPIACMLMFAAFFAFAMIASNKAEKKRRAELAQTASEMGLEYFEEGWDGFLDPFAEVKLFNRGRARRTRNVIQGQTDDVSIRLFEYFYTTGSGKNRRTHVQSVACLQAPELEIASFALRPQSAVFDAIGKKFGGQDIDFEDHPEFSRMFVLQGANEPAIRDQFTAPVLDFFVGQQGIWLEGIPGGLVFFRRNKRVPPSSMRNFLSEAYKVFAVLRDARI